jgi:hypothetical protein
MPITARCGPHCKSKRLAGRLLEHHCNCKRCHGKYVNGGDKKGKA